MPKVIRKVFIIALFFFALGAPVFGQVSDGGYPLETNTLKSANHQIIDLPPVSQIEIDRAMEANRNNVQLKPFRFALPIAVDLNPANSGQWSKSVDGYNVWQLTLHSSDAKSLIVMFEDFHLQEGSRLFVFNKNEDHYLGAFTTKNNKAGGKFAVSPLRGDEVTIQYEVPENLGTPSDFQISGINHDFIGILKSDRRPLGQPAGSCNIDVNCLLGEDYDELKNSICRVIVNSNEGSELCSGTLVNNTAEDGRPLILSAAHCYDEWEYAETTVYTFNYESPYCAPLDGDPSHSVSGAVMLAQHDSLDFALVEMSMIPPPEYRPYYAGWKHSAEMPDSTASIHHPYGDIKKIALDHDPPERSNFGRRSEYIKNAFLKIKEWDEGVTEIGSSGGGLFTPRGELIGTLTGGEAFCGKPVNDYFASFAVYWDYRADSTKQVKYWLDPLKSGVIELPGREYYSNKNLCKAFTNLNDNDEHANVQLTSGGIFSGYWGGSNNVGIDEIAERFSVPGDESLMGVSVGVGRLVLASLPGSEITLKVYNGDNTPKSLIYSKVVELDELVEDAMNYIPFDRDVQPLETFFIGFDLSNINEQDTFVMYQSLREETEENNYYFKLNGEWTDFKSNSEGSMVNVMELVACNYGDDISDTAVVDTPAYVRLFPNPTRSELTIQSDQEIVVETVSVFNLIGQEVNAPLLRVHDYEVKLDLSGNTPGVYVVRFNYNDSFVTRKFSLVPY
ncbi:T9SS type A sorting domain-containing protein [Maribellus mangrovi]|uniref:T9SS type A sorting domain-containing protein n=1 Tax=Maribellus mangrovi TaxID=3133146 RepID=UPI0030ED909F